MHFEILSNGKAVDPLSYPEIKREQLRGADLQRFRDQVERAVAERDRETALALVPAIEERTALRRGDDVGEVIKGNAKLGPLSADSTAQ